VNLSIKILKKFHLYFGGGEFLSLRINACVAAGKIIGQFVSRTDLSKQALRSAVCEGGKSNE
jgi:hypothetical protein